jgi:hypothetical protein
MWEWTDATPGEIVGDLIDHALARGSLDGVTYDFTDSLDSDGEAWAETTIDFVAKVGDDYTKILDELKSKYGVDHDMTSDLVFHLFNEQGSDDTAESTGPTLISGANVIDLTYAESFDDPANVALVVGGNVVHEADDPTSVSAYGRWETAVSDDSVVDAGVAEVVGQAAIQFRKAPQEQITAEVVAVPNLRPFVDMKPGDWIKVTDNEKGLIQARYRIMAITGRMLDGVPSFAFDLNSFRLEFDLRVARAVGRTLADVESGVGDSEDTVHLHGSTTILDGAITEPKIVSLAVTSAKLAESAVVTSKLAAGAVDNAKLADLAVDAAKLANSAVTATKIANLAVGSAAIQALAVGTAHIADAAIQTAKIGDLQVIDAKIGSLHGNKIVAGSITTQRLVVGSFDNLISNPGMETGAFDPGVIFDNAGSLWDVSSTVVKSGGFALHYNSTGQTGAARFNLNGWDGLFPGHVVCAQGDEFYIEYYHRVGASGTANRSRIFLGFFDETGTWTGDSQGSGFLTPDTAWEIGWARATAPAGAAYVVPTLILEDDGHNHHHYFDDFYMRKMVGDAIIQNLTADKIIAGTIDTGTIFVASRLEIAVNGLISTAAAGNRRIEVRSDDATPDDGIATSAIVQFFPPGTTYAPGAIYNIDGDLTAGVREQVVMVSPSLLSNPGGVRSAWNENGPIVHQGYDSPSNNYSQFEHQVRVQDGSSGAPTITRSANPNGEGIYFGSSQIGFVFGTVDTFNITSAGIRVVAGNVRVPNGSASAPSYQFQSFNGSGMWADASTVLRFSTDGTERAQVYANGLLAVSGNASNVGFGFLGDSDTGMFRPADGQVAFACASVEKAKFTALGLYMNVDGNASQPSIGLSYSDVDTGIWHPGDGIIEFVVNGSGAGNPAGMVIRDDSLIAVHAKSDNLMSLGVDGVRWTEVWAVDGSINTSDPRRKVELQDSDLGLDFVMALRPRMWKWEWGTRPHYGLAAPEVLKAVKEVGGSDFAGYIDPNVKPRPKGYWSGNGPRPRRKVDTGLRYTEFIGPLVKAVQEQQAQIDDLRRELEKTRAV